MKKTHFHCVTPDRCIQFLSLQLPPSNGLYLCLIQISLWKAINMEKTVFFTASYTVCLQLGFVPFLRILGPVSLWFSLHKSISNTGLAGFPLKDAALGWTIPSMQYNLKIFLQHMGCTEFAPIYLHRTKHFSADFWHVYGWILNGEQRRHRKQKAELGLFESQLQCWDAKGDCSHWHFSVALFPLQLC